MCPSNIKQTKHLRKGQTKKQKHFKHIIEDKYKPETEDVKYINSKVVKWLEILFRMKKFDDCR